MGVQDGLRVVEHVIRGARECWKECFRRVVLQYLFNELGGLVLDMAFLGHAGCDADRKTIGKAEGMPYFSNSAPTGGRAPDGTGKLPGHAAQLTGRQAVQRELRGTGQRGGLRVRRAGERIAVLR